MKILALQRFAKLLYYLLLISVVSFCVYWGIKKEPLATSQTELSKTSDVKIKNVAIDMNNYLNYDN